VHGRRSGHALRSALGEEVHRFAAHRLSEGEITGVEIGEEVVEGPRIHHRPGEAVLAQGARLLQHRDVELAEAAAGFSLPFGQPRQLDRAREPRRPRAHDHHVHLDRFRAGRITQDQLVEGKRALVTGRQDRGHGRPLLARGSHDEAAEI
jgi:hypothetical protein